MTKQLSMFQQGEDLPLFSGTAQTIKPIAGSHGKPIRCTPVETSVVLFPNRWYNESIGGDTMEIRVEFSDSALWGSTDPEAEGYDAKASAIRYWKLLTSELEREYPEAEIEVRRTINDRHMVDGREDHDEAEWIGEIINRVWTAWEWIVT